MKKMDEMELRINQKGIKWSWFSLVLSLFVWGTYNLVKTHEMTLPLILLFLQFVVYFFVTSVAKLKVDDNSGKKQILFFCIVICLILVLGAILCFSIGRFKP